MARKRQIEPGFFRHEELYMLEKTSGLPCRVAFAGLWTVADREGRFRWKPNELKLDILPYDELDFGRVLEALESSAFIESYEVDGRRYGYIPSWHEHQTPHLKEQASTIPAPCKPSARTVQTPEEHDNNTINAHRNTEYGIQIQEQDNPAQGKPTPDSLSQLVATELRITDRWIRVAISEQIQLAIKDEDPKAIVEQMVKAGNKYKSSPDFRFGGFKKFFSTDLWRSKAGQPEKSVSVNELREQQRRDAAAAGG